ncbi:Crp/Fnr family transcriptional regulator [Prolixibacter denitrificans]|nr:Crp/Fnr family transcriptional regulator [Prolixibacter denitrificans]
MRKSAFSTQLLRNCTLCSEKSCAAMALGEDELQLLEENCSEGIFRKGEEILSEGSLTSHIIYLQTGLVKEYIKSGDQPECIVQIIQNHAYLGLPSLFGDRVNHYSYAALTDVAVCFIDVAIFKQFILDNGKFAFEILSTVSRDSLTNYHRFISQGQKKIYGKLADTLLYFSKAIFRSNRFRLPLNRNEISYLIGTSRESVSKQLNSFVRDGIISLRRREIIINEPEKLEQISRLG